MTSIQDVGQLCVSVCACHFLFFFFSFKYVKEKEKEVKVVKEMEQLNLRNQGDKGGIFFPLAGLWINTICHSAARSLKGETVLPSCEICVA